MSNNESDIDLDNQESNELDSFDLFQDNQGDTYNESQTNEKHNKSNWKKMSEALKNERITNQTNQSKINELEDAVRYLAQQTNSLQSNGDNTENDTRIGRMEQDLFLSKNPEAGNHFIKIMETRDKFYGMSLEDAWKFVKADLQPKTQESKSTNDFDFRSEPIKIKKNLADVTPEEALNLPKEQLYQWQKLNGYQS